MSLDLGLEVLDRAETSLAKATDLCLKPSPQGIEDCRKELESAAASLQAVCQSIELMPVDRTVVLDRLKQLQRLAVELRTLHRQAIWILRATEQQAGYPILGYSPTGVEVAR